MWSFTTDLAILPRTLVYVASAGSLSLWTDLYSILCQKKHESLRFTTRCTLVQGKTLPVAHTGNGCMCLAGFEISKFFFFDNYHDDYLIIIRYACDNYSIYIYAIIVGHISDNHPC